MRLLVLWMAVALGVPAWSQEVTGIVVRVGRAHRSMVVSCDEVAGVMGAMEMSFAVRDGRELGPIHAGVPVRFTMLKRRGVLYASGIHAEIGANLESEPMEAGGLSALGAALRPAKAPLVAQGQPVPDFALTDQAGRQVRLAGLEGKVVLLTFGYSRCPNPAYCLRLSNNLARVRDRFAGRCPRDLVLLTIAIDPEHDQGATLREYAAVWKADPESWHFLTGPLPVVKGVAGMFGMDFWRREGLLTHSLRTVVIDRSGRLAANLEGNGFTARQLGDLVGSVMEKTR